MLSNFFVAAKCVKMSLLTCECEWMCLRVKLHTAHWKWISHYKIHKTCCRAIFFSRCLSRSLFFFLLVFAFQLKQTQLPHLASDRIRATQLLIINKLSNAVNKHQHRSLATTQWNVEMWNEEIFSLPQWHRAYESVGGLKQHSEFH